METKGVFFLTEIIGEKLFLRAFEPTNRPVIEDVQLNNCDFRQKLQVFFEAYGNSKILPTLSLRSDPIFLNDTIDGCWWLYCYLTKLDLAHCGLGNSHDIFSMLLPTMCNLQILVLRGNLLSDDGIRRLTLWNRMHREQALPLTSLDISENIGITTKSMDFVRYLPKLAMINVSGTDMSRKMLAVPGSADSIQHWRVITDKGNSTCECVRSCLEVTTTGWGASTVYRWRAQLTQRRQQKTKGNRSGFARIGMIDRGDKFSPTFYTNQHAKLKDISENRDAKATSYVNCFLTSHLFSCVHTNETTPSCPSSSTTCSQGVRADALKPLQEKGNGQHKNFKADGDACGRLDRLFDSGDVLEKTEATHRINDRTQKISYLNKGDVACLNDESCDLLAQYMSDSYSGHSCNKRLKLSVLKDNVT